MKKFLVLTLKEIKELLTPQMIIPLVITVVLFMFIGQVVGSQSKAIEKEKVRVAVIDQDSSNLSAFLKSQLSKQGFKVITYKDSVSKALKREIKAGGNFLIFIPAGFEEKILEGNQGKIKIYVSLPSFSFAGVQKASKLKLVISGINEAISSNLISGKTGLNLLQVNYLKTPVKFDEYVKIGSKQAKGSAEAIISFVSNQGAFLPIIMTIVIIFSSQAVATAIAAEKENKTLETLLASPVSRTAIALSKMLASGLIALLAAVFYLFGFRTYISSLTTSSAGNAFNAEMAKIAEQLGLKLSAFDYFLLGIMIFSSVMVALALSIILGSFTDSVKSVQSVITPLMVLILIPYLLTLFVDLNYLPEWARILVYSIPFTHTLQAVQNLFFSRYDLVLFGILYQLLLFGALLYFVSEIFKSDRILTMKIRFKTKD